MIITKYQYQCDFTGKKSFDKNKFLEIHLFSGREFDGCHQYEDVYETFHIYKPAINKILGKNFEMPEEKQKQKKLAKELHELHLKYLINKYKDKK